MPNTKEVMHGIKVYQKEIDSATTLKELKIYRTMANYFISSNTRHNPTLATILKQEIDRKYKIKKEGT